MPVSLRIPAGTWDSHMHVIQPNRFPIAADAKYDPPTHTIAEAVAFEKTLGIQHMVLVQPSCYGHDNSCLLDALKGLGPGHGRGVVAFDPLATSPELLKEWHALGVRGVRINLQSVGRILSKSELEEELQQYAALIRPLDWAIQLYIPMDMITILEEVVSQLRVKICIDHFGSPPANALAEKSQDPKSIKGFSSLLRLLQQGNTWVKVSAQYRLSTNPQYRDLEAMFHEMAAVAPNRLIYATDWPHTRFKDVDSKPFIDACLRWANKHDIVDSLFRDAAKELWDV